MTSSRAPLEPPDLNGYEFVSRLGSGGFADVFLYERVFPRQKVAIKVLAPEALGETGRERFTGEANAMASVSNHPYIVSIYQADISDEGHPFIVMEYYPKPNFSVRARSEKFAVAGVLRVGIQVAAAVETAHRAGILHRDIKPANILTSEYGRPGLTDFGIAATAEQRSEEAEGLSIPWSPPEVIAGGATDERADVYSLGATLYTLLTSRSPFEVPGGSNRSIDLIDRVQRAVPEPIERPDVPAALKRLLGMALSKDPGRRPASAMELARALQVIEVEQRFDMTAFEVNDDLAAAPEGTAIDADAGSTRMRNPTTIESQTQSTASFRPDRTAVRTSARAARDRSSTAGLIHQTPYQPTAGGPAPTPVPAGFTPVAKSTTAFAQPASGSYVAPAVPVDDTTDSPTPEPPREKRSVVIGAVGVAVSLVVVVAVLALGGGRDGDKPDTSSTSTSPSSTSVVELEQLPPPAVQVAPSPEDAGMIVAQWSYPVADVRFRVTVAEPLGSGTPQTQSESFLKIPGDAEDATVACVEVIAFDTTGRESETGRSAACG